MRTRAAIVFLLVPLVVAAMGESVRVLRVVDGDTIVVESAGVSVKVRLIGVDTPESRVNDKALGDAQSSGKDVKTIVFQGKKASAFMKTQVRRGDIVTLEFDAQLRDRYGRLLAYVYLEDGRMLNEVIVRSGYASPMTIPPNVKHQGAFQKAYKHARENGLGLWSEK